MSGGKMDEKPKNVVLLLNGKTGKASTHRGMEIKNSTPMQDYAIRGYYLAFAINGGYVIEVSYEGTELKDFLAFATKEEALASLAILLK
jgi:hypothetical protein